MRAARLAPAMISTLGHRVPRRRQRGAPPGPGAIRPGSTLIEEVYTVGSLDPDHDAVMRIGGEAPGGGSILSVGIKCQVRIRRPATSDRQFGSRAEASASAENGGECYARSGRAPFRTLDVRRRPPVVRQ